MEASRVLIVLLNWNGWEDTIECLKSLGQLEVPQDVLVLDNGSENDSIARLEGYLSSLSSDVSGEKVIIDERKILVSSYNVSGVIFRLCCLSENLGFSAGCNLAVKYAEDMGYAYSLLLNNDTVLEPGSLQIMREVLSAQSADIVIPQIRYFDRPEIIWNCGGEVSRWGRVRYYFSGKNGSSQEMKPTFPIGFATGCCMLFKVGFFRAIGGFTERFFFGEEDVELSFRLRRMKSVVVCATQAVIYHKVGASIRGKDELIFRKTFIHYLNRFINMRAQLPSFAWHAWRFLIAFKVALTLRKNFGKPAGEILAFIRLLMRQSSRLPGVDKALFKSVLSKGVDYNEG
ncbi:glycosyltransferase family 2 protein [Pseudomonas aeruginosa]|uniref:glycosyltransferase family 2 protein n=1 Tax=Pseudomonas aeruginosa TaxID=287 RepID=UPI0029534F35|nr:glycosyltransferase family 2 protein [Pseudomonas aeruginosa]MDV7848333.1 glycosyltransferase family 2 protein [Pseudomonas aeruginosa]